jgi:hypothetical protein
MQRKSSIFMQYGSSLKTSIVTCLAWLLTWRPRLAMFLGRLIWRLLPWLKEAWR